ncbi:S41 family peptidase [Tahibacter amnicola]|uniref:S41 family peptidase n=1 Tax=Tahibacter amnicola TaxID=2976241 RepID=A0ABY6BEJ2_9GAMM|nr:S41 family peptidase [Tahibacter amnicola]UXI68220.1 S41 family peptidase [Tahibacter amnicola]
MRAVVLAACIALAGGVHAETTVAAAHKGDTIDRKTVRRSVSDTVKLLNDVYVYPDTARRVGLEMIDRLEAGAYDRITTRQEFASRIGSELDDLSGDGHLGVLVAEGGEAPTHVMKETTDRFRLNYGFEKLEILPGNIGYLKLNKFFPDDEARNTADHALGFLGGTDALILDLSECKGGSPELVSHMLSYFFAEKTLLWSIVDRNGKSVHDTFSTTGAGPARFQRDYPLIILTGPDTASAAELFAYTLKSFGKARTVGQGTTGIAHIVGALPINEHFVGRFSTYRTINPVTKTDWEGVGIPPDAVADTQKRLDVAVAMARATPAQPQ